MNSIAYLSLGSNLGDREAQLASAMKRLTEVGRIIARSSFYETEPLDFTNQPWFLNCALALETSKTPSELMQAILAIEQQMGRVRLQDKGPRLIDIDILLFGKQIINSQALTIPHPAMHQRRFVLAPLAEIAPDLVHPVLQRTIRELLADLPNPQVVKQIKGSNCHLRAL